MAESPTVHVSERARVKSDCEDGDWVLSNGALWACHAGAWCGFDLPEEAEKFWLVVAFEELAGFTKCRMVNQATLEAVDSGLINGVYDALAQWFSNVGATDAEEFWMKLESE